MRILYLFAALVALSSCSVLKTYPVEQKYNEEWKGRSHSDIVKRFGAPDRVESDGSGGQILIYENVSTTTTTDVDTHFGMFDPDYTTKVQTNKSYIHFFVGPDNICYHIKSNRTIFDPQSKAKAKTTLGICAGVWGTVGIILPMIFLL